MRTTASERHEILDAIQAELDSSSEYYEFVVSRREREGNVWKVFVDSEQSRRGGLDESLEGASTWWGGPSKGGADVLSVIPEDEQINLRFATVTPPGKGGRLRVYPPRYLEALQSCWRDAPWASECFDRRDTILAGRRMESASIPSVKDHQWLRAAQKEAFDLLKWKAGFLWGPPGTGKTTTVGVLLAQYLTQFPDKKVLLCATTNSAVDQVLVSVDRSLERMRGSGAETARSLCFRLGNHFLSEYYEERRHLIPVKDQRLIQQLTIVEASRPDKETVEEYARWREAVDALRAEIRKQSRGVLHRARVAALTITRAAFTLEELRSFAPYDLIVFDEVSQAGIPHALALCPLSRQVLFAGDPRQLAPIVQSNHPAAERWFGESMFAYREDGKPWTVFLDEQSRMAEPICRVVSDVFYEGRLKVAKDKARDPAWIRERELIPEAGLSMEHFQIARVPAEGKWSKKYRGPIRYESADMIREIVEDLVGSYVDQDVIVLTPFRAQRALIRAMLKSGETRKVRVSTVHRAQGSEHHTVLFDPAHGDNDFLRTDDAERLINVAFSRAKARLIVFLSAGDRKNKLFGSVATVFENAHRMDDARDICDYSNRPDFPGCCIGKVVKWSRFVGEILEVLEGEEKFIFKDFRSGQTKAFSTEAVRRYCRRKGLIP